MVVSSNCNRFHRCQVSVACLVAMETLDPLLCGVAVKRAVMKLRELYSSEFSKEENDLVKDLLKLLQLMCSKVRLVSSH